MRQDLHSFPTRRSSDLGVRRFMGVSAHDCGICGKKYGLDLGNDRKGKSEIRQYDEVLRHWSLRGNVRRRRSEEHTSELQSLRHIVCRLLLAKKKKKQTQ